VLLRARSKSLRALGQAGPDADIAAQLAKTNHFYDKVEDGNASLGRRRQGRCKTWWQTVLTTMDQQRAIEFSTAARWMWICFTQQLIPTFSRSVFL
jgi:hypothetical protein